MAAPGLAGHQAALSAVRAWAVLDHHRDRHHGRRDGRVVFQALPLGPGGAPGGALTGEVPGAEAGLPPPPPPEDDDGGEDV